MPFLSHWSGNCRNASTRIIQSHTSVSLLLFLYRCTENVGMWTMKAEEFGGGMTAGNAGQAVRGYWCEDVLSLVPPLERHLTQALYRSKLPEHRVQTRLYQSSSQPHWLAVLNRWLFGIPFCGPDNLVMASSPVDPWMCCLDEWPHKYI